MTLSSARARSSATSGSARSRVPADSTRASTERDPSLRTLDRRRPVRHRPGAARAWSGDARRRARHRAGRPVLLWPGGIWNWFDPLTVIRAVARALAATRRRAALLPRPAAPESRRARMPHAAMAERGDRARGGARAARPRRLLQLRLGAVRRARPLPARRRRRRLRAFRRRRDALRLPNPSPRLPLGGPAQSSRRAATRSAISSSPAAPGSAVDFGDVDGWVEASSAARRRRRAAARHARRPRALRPIFEWPRVLEPLRQPRRPASTASAATARLDRAAGARYVSLRLRIGVARHGLSANNAPAAHSRRRAAQVERSGARVP